MYNRFVELLQKNNVKPSNVAKATGINPTVFSEWKKGKSIPKQDKLKKIADYFGVSVDYLMTGKEPETKAPITDEDVKVALFGGDKEVTDEMWEEVRGFVDYVKQKYSKPKK